MFRAVKPRIGNRCTASGDLCIRISGINRVLFSYCFRQFLRFRSDSHCFDSWRLARDFSVTARLTVIYRYFSANRDEDSKVFRKCIDASAIFSFYTGNPNPHFSGCRNRIFDFDIPALDLTSFEWTYVLPYAPINFPLVLPSICLRDMGKTKLIREATCEGHISCRLRGMTIRKRGMYSQYSRRNLGSIIRLASPHVRASVMDHGESAGLGRGWCRRAQGRQDRGGRHARSRPERCCWGQNRIHGHQRRQERRQRRQDPC